MPRDVVPPHWPETLDLAIPAAAWYDDPVPIVLPVARRSPSGLRTKDNARPAQRVRAAVVTSGRKRRR